MAISQCGNLHSFHACTNKHAGKKDCVVDQGGLQGFTRSKLFIRKHTPLRQVCGREFWGILVHKFRHVLNEVEG